jgi:hypothetical protein
LEQDLVWAQHNGFQADSIVRPLVARLKDDPQAIQAIQAIREYESERESELL